MSHQPTSSPATRVTEERRLDFLSDLFGAEDFLVGELTVYSFMDQLSSADYDGGVWEFYERDGRPLYLVPTAKPTYRMAWGMNGYAGEVSADAAGIIATLFALSHLSFQAQSDALSDAFHRLYDYAAAHADAHEIFRAID